MEALNIETVQRPNAPNNFLLAPEEDCRECYSDGISPIFDIPADALKTKLMSYLAEKESRIDILLEEDTAIEVRQKTPVLGFPDFVSVTFLDVPNGRSTLAIYSRSKYGHSDLGVNKARVLRWVTALQDFD